MQEAYEIRDSARAKTIRITVHPDGRVVVTKPLRASAQAAHRLVAKHKDWILGQLKRVERRGPQKELPTPRKNSSAYKAAREKARAIAHESLNALNSVYKFTYGTVSIRDQKTRWGSCSASGNLSFNYRIAYLPSELVEYLIAHELCHLKEHNHSERFWTLVAHTIPDYKARRKELHTYALGS